MTVPTLDAVIVNAVVMSIDRMAARARASIRPPTDHTLEALHEYWQRACAVLGEDLALLVAADVPAAALGTASYSVISAPSLGAAIDVLANVFLPALVPWMTLRTTQVSSGYIELQLHSDGDECMTSMVEEIVLAVMCQHFVQLACAQIIAVGLRRAAPADTTPWQRYFRTRMRFHHRNTFLRLRSEDLMQQMRTANPTLHQMLAAPPLTDDLVARARAHLRSDLATTLSLAELADALATSQRTLQRKLRAAGTSLRELAAAVRIEAARSMLETSDHSIEEIAHAVGFARGGSLGRVFANTVGVGPQEYRRRARAS